LGQKCNKPFDLFECEKLLLGQIANSFLRHAIKTSEVASVSHCQPYIIKLASMIIVQCSWAHAGKILIPLGRKHRIDKNYVYGRQNTATGMFV
jgi:hypothetical protein